MYHDNSTNNRHTGPAIGPSTDDRTERIAPAYSVIGEQSHEPAAAISGGAHGPTAVRARYEHDAAGSLRYVDPVPTKYDSMSLNAGRPRPDGSIEEPGGPMILAFAIDLLLHTAIGAAVWLIITKYSPDPHRAIALAVITAVTTSFVHRTFIQRLTRTTLGKAPFGLQLRYPDKTSPTLWQLIKLWLVGAFAVVSTPLQIFG